MTQTTEYRIIGITDEQTECDACGRVELKRTVVLADSDGVEAGRYGTTCASKIVGRPLTAAHVDNIEAVRRSNMIRPDEIELADRIKAAAVAILRRRRDEGHTTTMGPNTLPPKGA